MISLHKILRPEYVAISEEPVLIPDYGQAAAAAAEGEAPPPAAMSVAEAQRRCDELMNMTKAECEKLRQEAAEQARQEAAAIATQAHKDGEAIRELAYQDGFAAGAQEKAQEIERAFGEIRQSLEQIRMQQHAFIREYERELTDFSLDIAAKVTEKRLERDDLELAELVKHVVNSIRDADWISVEISDKLPKLAAFLEKEYAQGTRTGTQVEINPAAAPADTVIVQTSEGVIDASVSTQLANLKEYFNRVE